MDYREVTPLNAKTTLAYRINFGFAYPYGREASLPYEKRFFVGGSNSVRAWPVRRLGPGSYGIAESGPESSEQNTEIIQYSTETGPKFDYFQRFNNAIVSYEDNDLWFATIDTLYEQIYSDTAIVNGDTLYDVLYYDSLDIRAGLSTVVIEPNRGVILFEYDSVFYYLQN
jgi:hypothetical protein